MPTSPQFDSSDPLLDDPVVDRLDLHGRTAGEASALVKGFLAAWAGRGSGSVVVHIITGKGRGSPGVPVLREPVGRLLKGALGARVTEWARDEDDGGYKVRLR